MREGLAEGEQAIVWEREQPREHEYAARAVGEHADCVVDVAAAFAEDNGSLPRLLSRLRWRTLQARRPHYGAGGRQAE